MVTFNVRLALALMTTLFALFGCQPAEKTAERTGPLVVVATTGMVADMVKQVGGGEVQVTALMGPGVDPHLYKASPGDVQKLQTAELIVGNGLFLEGKLGQALTAVSRRVPLLELGASLPADKLLSHSVGAPDPHIWFDVALWSRGVDPLSEKLSELRPDKAELFRANAEAYRKQLLALDEEVRKQIQQIPAERRLMITAHDAFHYFGRAYGIEVKGIQGISTESEAGLREVNELIALIVRRNVPAVFVETSVSQKNVQALVEGARSQGHQVSIGGSLYSDAMGTAGTPDGTYVGMVRHNVRVLTEALR